MPAQHSFYITVIYKRQNLKTNFQVNDIKMEHCYVDSIKQHKKFKRK